MSDDGKPGNEPREGARGALGLPSDRPVPRTLIIAALTILCLALLPQFSIPPGHIVTGWGLSPELDPVVAWRHLAPTWSWAAGLGFDGSTGRPVLFPFVVAALALRSLGLSAEVVCRLWYAGLFVLQGVGVAMLAGEVFRRRIPRDQMLIIQFFAVVNPLQLITLRSAFLTTDLSFAAMPALLAIAIQYVRSRSIAKFIGFIALAGIAATGDANVAVFAAEATLLVAVALLWFRRRDAQPMALLGAAFLSINAIWIVPAVGDLLHALPFLGPATEDYTAATLKRVAAFSAWPHSARLVGGYLFFNPLAGSPYLPEGASYDHNPFVFAASCAVPLLALAGLIAGILAKDRDIIKVGIIAILALFFAKGNSAPFGDIFAFLSTHTFVFRAFRDSFAKLEWIVLFAYAILAARCFAELDRLGGPIRTTLLCGSAAAIAVAGYPILIGHLFWPHITVSIPQRYLSLAAKLNSEGDDSVVAEIPMAPYLLDAYRWGYVGFGLNAQLIERPILSGAVRLPSPINEQLGSVLEHVPRFSRESLGSWLGLHGVGGLLVDDSLDPSIHVPAAATAPFPVLLPHMHITWREEGARLYSIDPALVNPRLYLARNVIRGTYSANDVGLTCRALNGCRASAFIANDNALLGLKADRAFVVRHPVFEMAQLSAPLRDSALRTFVDDADRTGDVTGSVGTATYRTVFPTNPAILKIAPSAREKNADAVVDGAITIRTPTRFCRPSRRAVELNLTPLTFRGLGVLALTYSSDQDAGARLLIHSNRGDSETWLPDGAGRASVVRIMPLDPRVRARLLLQARPSAACLTIEYFTFARFLRESPYTRVRSAPHGSSTPYQWLNQDPLATFDAAAPLKLASCIGECRARSSEERRSALSIQLVGKGPTTVARASGGAVCSHSRNAIFRTDSIRLIPGLEYVMRLVVKTSAPALARIALQSEDRSRVADSAYELGIGSSFVDFSFVAPSGIANAVVVAGVDSSSRGSAACVLQGTLSQRAPPTAFRIALARPAPTPWRLERARSSASHYELTIHLDEDAPQLVILNQTFDDRWVLTTRPRVFAEHVSANGGVNGWVVRGKGDTSVFVRYAGADLAVRCLIGGLVGLCVTIILARALSRYGGI